MEGQLPSQDYRAHRGLQGTWEVSFHGEHLAKRSFQKYGSEDAAAAQVLWIAWCHHTRRTGQPCQLEWLLARFDISAGGELARTQAAATLDNCHLADLKPPRRPRQTVTAGRPAKKARAARAAADKPTASTAASNTMLAAASSTAVQPTTRRPRGRPPGNKTTSAKPGGRAPEPEDPSGRALVSQQHSSSVTPAPAPSPGCPGSSPASSSENGSDSSSSSSDSSS